MSLYLKCISYKTACIWFLLLFAIWQSLFLTGVFRPYTPNVTKHVEWEIMLWSSLEKKTQSCHNALLFFFSLNTYIPVSGWLASMLIYFLFCAITVILLLRVGKNVHMKKLLSLQFYIHLFYVKDLHTHTTAFEPHCQYPLIILDYSPDAPGTTKYNNSWSDTKSSVTCWLHRN